MLRVRNCGVPIVGFTAASWSIYQRPSLVTVEVDLLKTRRDVLKSTVAGAFSAAGLPMGASWAQRRFIPTEEDYFDGSGIDHGVEYRRTNMALIPREYRPQITREIIDPEPGRIVIDSREHFLYLTRADGAAIRYAVGIGREGFQWYGSAQVMRKAVWPTWTPPREMVKRNPDISPGTMPGGPKNPMGQGRYTSTETGATCFTAFMGRSSRGL